MTETRAQRNNDSLANAATVLTTRKGLDAFKLKIDSVKVTVETIQYAPDSAHKAIQEEWTGI